MSAISDEKAYRDFLLDIKDRIRAAQYAALKEVNRELIGLYWDIGKKIVEKQKGFGWGKSVVEMLAKDLQKEYAGTRGFSAGNLWRMKNFYLQYSNNKKAPNGAN